MAANGVVVWEWQNEYSNWQPYSPQISTFIESHQSSGQPLPLGQVDSSLYLYTVDVANMCQTRQGIGKFSTQESSFFKGQCLVVRIRTSSLRG